MLNTLGLALPRLTYFDTAIEPQAVEQAASALRTLLSGIPERDVRIAFLLENSPLFIASLLSAASLEQCAVLLNPALSAAELERALAVSDADLLLADENYPAETLLAAEKPRAVGAFAMPPYGALRLWTLECDGDAKALRRERMEREFIVQFTSGVSGMPLAVMRTYGQARNEIDAYIRAAGLCGDDIVLCAVPLFHSFGLFAGLLSSLRVGARFAIMPVFSPADVIRMTLSLRPTVFLGVPLFYELLARTQTADHADFSSYRLLLSAGGPLAPDTASQVREKFGKEISQLYGTTETGVIAMNGPGIAAPSVSVGKALAGRAIRITNEQGEELPVGAEGEIALASPATASGYLGRPELTARKFRNGCYFTEDIGRIDPDGCLYITGRKSAFINVGGLKVDPAEVENAILSSGEALECAVVGIERPQFGEIIRAHVVLKPGGSIERIRAHCRGRLAGFKLPRDFQPVASLPRSATGKVLRKYLME